MQRAARAASQLRAVADAIDVPYDAALSVSLYIGPSYAADGTAEVATGN